jgi:hypothetical protein
MNYELFLLPLFKFMNLGIKNFELFDFNNYFNNLNIETVEYLNVFE